MKYRLEMDSDYGDFVEGVNHALANGWELQGGVAIRQFEDPDGTQTVVFYQALVKNDEK